MEERYLFLLSLRHHQTIPTSTITLPNDKPSVIRQGTPSFKHHSHVDKQQCLEVSVLDLDSAVLKAGCHYEMEGGAPQSVSCHQTLPRAAYATAASVNQKMLPFLCACHSVNPDASKY